MSKIYVLLVLIVVGCTDPKPIFLSERWYFSSLSEADIGYVINTTFPDSVCNFEGYRVFTELYVNRRNNYVILKIRRANQNVFYYEMFELDKPEIINLSGTDSIEIGNNEYSLVKDLSFTDKVTQ